MYLETNRLILRKPDLEDVDTYLEFINSEFVQQYNVMLQATRKSVEAEFQNTEEDSLLVAIELKSSGKIIGIIHVHEDSIRFRVASKEISYFLREEESRKGYMKEALFALIEYLFQVEQLECIAARCFLPNIASRRLLESLAFKMEGIVRKCVKGYKEVVYNDCLYSLQREEWETFKGENNTVASL